MKVFVPREGSGETRVAMSPDVAKKLASAGIDVLVEKGAGEKSRITDEAFKSAGAQIVAGSAGKTADVVFRVRRPTASEANGYKKGALVFATMDPHGNEKDIAALGKSGISAFAMEFMPRITRAQSMDILSSQANLAGYQAVIEGSVVFDRALPMMMTAAGTVPAARVFVMGAGVAGLQAIATARRLGAVVSATDVRAAAGEQVASLGAKFIMTDALKDASGEGGYARELTKEEQKAQSELVASHISKQDIVITTALIPGRHAPRLVSKQMVASMQPGSVLVDLAVERGGNVEGSRADEIVTMGGVSIVGYQNMAGRVPATASQLYAKNLFTFLETMLGEDGKSLSVDHEDELVKATLLTHGGKVVHPAFAGAETGSDKKDAEKTPSKSAAKPRAGSSASKSGPAAAKKKSPRSAPSARAKSKTGKTAARGGTK